MSNDNLSAANHWDPTNGDNGRQIFAFAHASHDHEPFDDRSSSQEVLVIIRRLLPKSGVAAAALFCVLATAVAAQNTERRPVPGAPADRSYVVPRTPDGQPDLQGVWANNMATPLERPKELADKPLLTDAELEDFKQRAARLFAGADDSAFGDGIYQAVLANPERFKRTGTADYNSFWLVDREFEHRTSLIFDPPDGRLPPRTPEGEKRLAEEAERRRTNPADGPEDLNLGVRCITYGVPRVGGLNAGYNSYYQIVQGPGYVALNAEMIHETRIIPLDGRPHLPSSVRQWMGDPRGRWEGETLVVETTNFSPQSSFMGARENLRVVERFTRVADDTLQYEVTVNDPTTWTSPWSALVIWKRKQEQVYEFACHEGNRSMLGILAGARVQERKAAEGNGPQPR
jgi:hypothetical protein